MAGLHAERPALLADVLPVLFDIGGVDTEHIGFGIDTVDEDVVHDAAVPVGHTRILHLAVEEFRHVVGSDALQQVERLGALDPDFAHVAHVEDTGAVAYGHVLVVDPRELDRHIISREFGHLGPRGNVVLGKCCGFHIGTVLGFTRGVSPPGADSGGTPSSGRRGNGRWCVSYGA